MYFTNAAPFWAAFFISKITKIRKIRKKIMNTTILSIAAFASVRYKILKRKNTQNNLLL